MAKIFGEFHRGYRRNKNLPQSHVPNETTLGVSMLESQGSLSPSSLKIHKLPSILGWWVPHSLFPLAKREHKIKQQQQKFSRKEK